MIIIMSLSLIAAISGATVKPRVESIATKMNINAKANVHMAVVAHGAILQPPRNLSLIATGMGATVKSKVEIFATKMDINANTVAVRGVVVQPPKSLIATGMTATVMSKVESIATKMDINASTVAVHGVILQRPRQPHAAPKQERNARIGVAIFTIELLASIAMDCFGFLRACPKRKGALNVGPSVRTILTDVAPDLPASKRAHIFPSVFS